MLTRWFKGDETSLRQAFGCRGIGRRLLISIILFSSVVTLLATAVQLFTDYRRDIGVIKSRLADIESSYMASISASLWNLDVSQLRLQLDGILHLPDISAVAVHESGADLDRPLVIELGEFSSVNVIEKEYPIVRRFNATDRIVGILKVQASLKDVYARLWDKAVVILLSQGVKTFLVSLFILYVFHRLVTVHLGHIARYLSGYDIAAPVSSLALNRDSKGEADELDMVVNSFNELTDKLVEAYEHMRQVNLALADDIVARRRAEHEVKRLNSVLEDRVKQRTSELEAANGELASFCYSVSHDLRAPLRRIEGFRRILAEQMEETCSDQQRHFLRRIETGTQEMSEMIDSFLQLSRATQSELKVISVNLSDLVSLAVEQLQSEDSERNVEVKIEDAVWVEADYRFAAMLINNLIHNAWKYTSKKEVAKIEFGCQGSGNERVFFVRDNGAGFDMRYAGRLFSPFTRLHKSSDFEGIGVGLATVQRIVARHGGKVWADARPNEGASFYFTFWDRNRDGEQGYDTAGGGQSG
ncbi:sensor histidine kinase [Gilvimarinus chinensis]|uniref:sensor histidine kinase n=1 Tax=Gilvimarinus chinensis TaxID=396005 RepID=UPI00037DAA28|nr:ATP-binding protein [Gilvimarinus chinensis]